MERVTQKNERGYYLLGDGIYSDWGVPEKFRGDDVDRLAAYEDTGLEPEEIKATFTPEAVIKLAAQALGTTPDRLEAGPGGPGKERPVDAGRAAGDAREMGLGCISRQRFDRVRMGIRWGKSCVYILGV